MRLILLFCLWGCAFAKDETTEIEKPTDVLKAVNKSLTSTEESKGKTEKRDSSDETAVISNYSNDEPFRPIISPKYDQYQEASSAFSQSVYDKNQHNGALNGGAQYTNNDGKNGAASRVQGSNYRGPFSPDVYHQQQQKSTLKNGNDLTAQQQQNTVYGGPHNIAQNQDRIPPNYHFQPEQQSPPQQLRTSAPQQQRIQYVIAIPMSYVRQLLQQQQQQQGQHPHYPAPALPPQPLPASQIAATPSFTALIAHRPAIHQSPQQTVHEAGASLAPHPTAPTHSYAAPVLPLPINALLSSAAQIPLGYQQQPFYRPIYQQQQPQQPQQLLASASQPQIAQYQIYQQPSQSPRPAIPFYVHAPGQATAAPIPMQLIQATPFALRYPQQPTLVRIIGTGPPAQQSPAQQVAATQQHNIPVIHYASPFMLQRVQLAQQQQQQQQQQHQPQPSPEESHNLPGSQPFVRLAQAASTYLPTTIASPPSHYYPLMPSSETHSPTYVSNVPSPGNKMTPFTNLILQPYSAQSAPYPSSGINEISAGGSLPYYTQPGSIHYGTHLLQAPTVTIPTKPTETGTGGNSQKSLYDIQTANTPAEILGGAKKLGANGVPSTLGRNPTVVKYP